MMTKIQNTKNNEKMAEYCKTCICKSCEQIAELKTENEQLKALCDTYRTCYQAKHSDIKCLFIKYRQTLQEIREYAESISNEEMINGYAIRAKSALWRIANKIAKAEEE